LLDVANDSFFIHDKRSTRAEETRFVEYAVVFHHFPFEIAEQREGDADLFGERCVCG